MAEISGALTKTQTKKDNIAPELNWPRLSRTLGNLIANASGLVSLVVVLIPTSILPGGKNSSFFERNRYWIVGILVGIWLIPWVLILFRRAIAFGSLRTDALNLNISNELLVGERTQLESRLNVSLQSLDGCQDKYTNLQSTLRQANLVITTLGDQSAKQKEMLRTLAGMSHLKTEFKIISIGIDTDDEILLLESLDGRLLSEGGKLVLFNEFTFSVVGVAVEDGVTPTGLQRARLSEVHDDDWWRRNRTQGRSHQLSSTLIVCARIDS